MASWCSSLITARARGNPLSAPSHTALEAPTHFHESYHYNLTEPQQRVQCQFQPGVGLQNKTSLPVGSLFK